MLLIGMLVAGYYYATWTDVRETVLAVGQKIVIVDGDSFAIGTRKLRLDGIDAPEYDQICNDQDGAPWPCGRVARAAMEKMLFEPSLSCEAEYHDRYARSLATCHTSQSPDIAAIQVRDGLAVSNDFNGMRAYGSEEDAARAAKRGIWRGKFDLPSAWRKAQAAAHPPRP